MADPEPTASAWPPIVALGLAAAELGVLFGLPAVAVGGVLGFAAGVAGVACEADLVATRRRAIGLVGVAIGTPSAGLWLARSSAATPEALGTAAAVDGIAARAAVVVGASVILVGAGIAAGLLRSPA